MKKLKVMYERPEVTEEELEKFMDFDQLLVKRNAFLKRRQVQRIAGAASTILVIAFVSWWMVSSQQNAQLPSRMEVAEPLQNTTTPMDSITVDEATTKNELPADETLPVTKPKFENPKPKEEIREAVQEPVYIQAAPVDGYANLYAYFENELIYPQAAIADSIQGTVTVHCIIGKDGKPANIQIENSLGALFDKEVIRIIENMPPWNPATLNAIPLESKISLPLSFKLKSVDHEK